MRTRRGNAAGGESANSAQSATGGLPPSGESAVPTGGHRRRRWLTALPVFGAVLVLAGTTATIALENHDPMCASCHLPPEATFVARASAGRPQDLAAAHARLDPAVKCIECHAGTTAAHRLRGVPLAARDAVAFVTGGYTVVGNEYAPIGAQSSYSAGNICLDCHRDVLASEAFEQHFHGLLDDPDAAVLACADCHRSHDLRPTHRFFISDQDVVAGCDECHAAMGGPSASLRGPGAPAGTDGD